jgi:hypothetical protein
MRRLLQSDTKLGCVSSYSASFFSIVAIFSARSIFLKDTGLPFNIFSKWFKSCVCVVWYAFLEVFGLLGSRWRGTGHTAWELYILWSKGESQVYGRIEVDAAVLQVAEGEEPTHNVQQKELCGIDE